MNEYTHFDIGDTGSLLREPGHSYFIIWETHDEFINTKLNRRFHFAERLEDETPTILDNIVQQYQDKDKLPNLLNNHIKAETKKLCISINEDLETDYKYKGSRMLNRLYEVGSNIPEIDASKMV